MSFAGRVQQLEPRIAARPKKLLKKCLRRFRRRQWKKYGEDALTRGYNGFI